MTRKEARGDHSGGDTGAETSLRPGDTPSKPAESVDDDAATEDKNAAGPSEKTYHGETSTSG